MSNNDVTTGPHRQTTREQFDRIAAVLRRAAQYWWLAGIIVVAGGVLSILFALIRQPAYESQTTLLYREMIPTEVLQGRAVAAHTRNLSSQYREMVLARKQLRRVIEEFELYPTTVANQGIEAAVDEMRLYLDFRDRGAGTFQIAYRDTDPHRAQRVVERLTELLMREEERVRREQASVTKDFLVAEKQRANTELHKKQKVMAEFLSRHPEFARETITMTMPGASIRAQAAKLDKEEEDPNLSPQLQALHRQRSRIKAQLEAPDRPVSVPKSPERLAAESKLRGAQRDLDAAQTALRQKLAQGLTDAHPDIRTSRQRVTQAQQMVKQIEADMPPENPILAAGPVDRDALRRELNRLEAQIRQERSRGDSGGKKEEAPEEAPEEENWVVRLETEWAALTRELEEARERVEALERKVFTAEITASSEMAEQGGKITVIDPAHVPETPVGKGKRIIVMAGTALFGMLAVALAFGLALIDDRIYSRYDLEQLGLAPVLATVPKRKARRLFWRAPRPPDAAGAPESPSAPDNAKRS